MRVGVTIDLSSAMQRARNVQAALRRNRSVLLTNLGTTLLSLSQQSYVQKARKQRGMDGITWAPLSRATLKARVMRRAPGRKIVEERRRLAVEIERITGTPEVRIAKPKRPTRLTARRRTIAARTKRKPVDVTGRLKNRLAATPKVRGKGKTKAEQVAVLRRKRLELLVKLESLVDAEQSRYEIGRDTGLQLASASPGFTAPDGKGGNLFRVEQDSVTVGYLRNYSKYFDAKRKLLPETIPADWQQRLDDQAQRWVDQQVQGATK